MLRKTQIRENVRFVSSKICDHQKKYAGAAALYFLVMSLGISGCDKSSSTKAMLAAPDVVASYPIKMPVVEWDEYVGRLTPVEMVEVRARVSGYLSSTHFEEGQIVNAGDVLMTIDQRPYIAAINQNEATLAASQAQLIQAQSAEDEAQAETKRAEIRRDLAQKNWERARRLEKESALAMEVYEAREAELALAESELSVNAIKIKSAKSAVVAAEANVGIAQANLDLAKLNLQYTDIRAPITGRISYFNVTKGNLVSGGTNDSTLLTTIVSTNPIHCYFDTDERAFLKYVQLAREGRRAGMRDVKDPVYLALANERDGFPHKGHTDFLENRLDEETGTIRIRAILSNDNNELTPGLFARVRIPGSPRYEAILVPDRSIGTDLAEKYVLIVDQDNAVRRQVVTLGPISHGLRVVRTGLDGTERVIISGQQKARPGEPVSVTMETLEAEEESLPDEYVPVPESEWLIPKRVEAANTIPHPDGAEVSKAEVAIESVEGGNLP